MALFPVSSYDVWWHLAAGRWIVAHRAVPRADPFSFTAAGHEWIDHEWLFQLAAYGAHGLAGVGGLITLRVVVAVAVALLLMQFVRREAGLTAPAAALLLLPWLLVARVRLLVRPELATLLLAAIVLTTLLRRRDHPAGWRELWWLPLLFVPWANLHAGAILGLLLLAAVLAGELGQRAVEGLRPPASPRPPVVRPGPLLGTLAAATACCLVNPFGARVLSVPFELTALVRDGPYHNAEWRPLAWPEDWLAMALMAVALAVVAIRWRRLQWAAVAPLVLVAALAIQHARSVGVFAVVAPLALARIWGVDEDAPAPLAGLRPAVAITALAAVAGGLLLGGYQFRPGLGVDRLQVPVAAADFLDRRLPPGNMLNTYKFGGYLTWRLWPRARVFMDGRNEVFVDLARRLKRAKGDSREWRRLLGDYDIGYAVLAYSDEPLKVRLMTAAGQPGELLLRPYTVQQFPRSRWALVHFDDTALVMVRRSPESAALVTEEEYRDLYPESVDYQLEVLAAGDADPRRALAELRRALAADPGCQRARRLLEAIAGAAGVAPGS